MVSVGSVDEVSIVDVDSSASSLSKSKRTDLGDTVIRNIRRGAIRNTPWNLASSQPI